MDSQKGETSEMINYDHINNQNNINNNSNSNANIMNNNVKSDKIYIQQFDQDYLESKIEELKNKVVIFDLSLNRNKCRIQELITFISINSSNWNGLGLDLRNQKKYFTKEDSILLSKSLANIEKLEYLNISFGGRQVSQYYAENNKNSHRLWETCSSGNKLYFNYYIDIFNNIFRIINNSQSILYSFVLDFQGLGDDCIKMLPILTHINISLGSCTFLEEFVLSFNHCDIYDNFSQDLTQFLISFEHFSNLTNLKIFIMNISGWTISYNNYINLCNIFSQYLSNSQLEEFQIDHSSPVQMNNIEDKDEIQILIESLKIFLFQHRQTLKIFYLSLVEYLCNDKQIEEISPIFQYLSELEVIQKISIRLYSWQCQNIQLYNKFHKNILLLSKLRNLKLFHLSTFNLQQRRVQRTQAFKFAQKIVQHIGQLNLCLKQNIAYTNIAKRAIDQYYRPEIFNHVYNLCMHIDPIQYNNESFHLTY